MLYINTFLDRVGELVRGEIEDLEGFLAEISDEERIVEMFRKDCEEILRMVEEGKVEVEDAKRNFTLLKSYVLTQLSVHYEKIREMAAEKGVQVTGRINAERINEIAMMIDSAETRLRGR